MTTVKTTSGEVRGMTSGGASSWKGIPYAAPPIGPLRFRAPQRHLGWTGVRDATSYGPGAMQPGSMLASKSSLGDGISEDCLQLNVWAPNANGAPRPVLVWIHGGAFASGAGAIYSGGQLAESGDIVVVSINYRMGVLGFADLGPVSGAEVDSNLGLRDQIAALTWVRDNIAAFGGDPDAVTVAGESAGSISISLLTTAPSATGLFRAAIMESGSYSLIHGEQVRGEVAERYARELGLSPRDSGRLWELPAEQLIAAQEAVLKASPGTIAGAPWFDGDLVPGSLEEARASRRPEIALLAGHNRDEVSLFQVLPGDIMPTTRERVAVRLREELGAPWAATVLATYDDTRRGNRDLCSDFDFSMPTQHFAARHAEAGGAAYLYRFEAAIPFLGATHAAELPYVWARMKGGALLLAGPRTARRQALGRRIRDHWISFVRSGQPAGDWPAYDDEHRHVRVFRPRGDRTERDPFAERRRAWAGADVMTTG